MQAGALLGPRAAARRHGELVVRGDRAHVDPGAIWREVDARARAVLRVQVDEDARRPGLGREGQLPLGRQERPLVSLAHDELPVRAQGDRRPWCELGGRRDGNPYLLHHVPASLRLGDPARVPAVEEGVVLLPGAARGVLEDEPAVDLEAPALKSAVIPRGERRVREDDVRDAARVLEPAIGPDDDALAVGADEGHRRPRAEGDLRAAARAGSTRDGHRDEWHTAERVVSTKTRPYPRGSFEVCVW